MHIRYIEYINEVCAIILRSYHATTLLLHANITKSEMQSTWIKMQNYLDPSSLDEEYLVSIPSAMCIYLQNTSWHNPALCRY